MDQIFENNTYLNKGLDPEIAIKKSRKISYVKIINAPTRKISLYYRKTAANKDLIKEITKCV